MPSSNNVLIIGAGPAGLTAAYRLLKDSKLRPTILEESGEIGGISRTAAYRGNRMDIGGHRFFSKSQAVNDLWQELMPFGDPEQLERVMMLRPRVSRIYYLRKFFDYPISMKVQTFKNMGLCRSFQAGFGFLASAVHKRPENSLEDFYINRFGKPLYAMFFEDYTEKLWGVHPSKIAPDWGAQRVKGLSLTKAILDPVRKALKPGSKATETSLIEQFCYPKRGPGQLYEAMADEIRALGGEIRLHSRVDRILMENGRAVGVAVNGEELPGDYVISTMPVKDLVAALGQLPPQHVREVAAALPYRDFITVGLLLKKLARDDMRDNWIYIQEREVRIGRLQIFNNWSPYLVKDPNTVWIGLEYFCTEGDDFWTMPQEDFIQMAIAELVKIGIIHQEDVLDATEIRVKKAYPAYFGTYSRFEEVRAWLDDIPNLFCAGRNGQHRYNNMDHSMLTAMESVNAILNSKNDSALRSAKAAIWGVNTEEEYHEQKQEA
jgi:protoporphyrinogen oxidase